MGGKQARLERTERARPPAGAHRRRAGGTAESIAEAALQILADEGVQAVTMHRIAQQLAITPMAIYYYYQDRDALLQHIVNLEIVRLAKLGAQLVASSTDADREHIIDAYLDYAFSRPHVFDYVFNTPREGGMKYPEDFRARKSPSLNTVADRVEYFMRAGLILTDDIWEVTMQLWAHAHGYVALYRSGRFSFDESEFRVLYRRAMTRLFTGLAPASTGPDAAIP